MLLEFVSVVVSVVSVLVVVSVVVVEVVSGVVVEVVSGVVVEVVSVIVVVAGVKVVVALEYTSSVMSLKISDIVSRLCFTSSTLVLELGRPEYLQKI
jgi:hypothetical protein